jgi:hypothetical protein
MFSLSPESWGSLSIQNELTSLTFSTASPSFRFPTKSIHCGDSFDFKLIVFPILEATGA